ncbi:hypothetical protein LY28_00864 [Ruminiclostridium sufflavum DSM 19573]|uniref:Uncharacterized protein n=1 Tax=Ruminiclostridium sufflavum DSM 19573 TaxID=1121337 RepID=A0A318Y9G7_9FIRM|nr:hypothetical protein LY28_00864 [Ruminiclostridium sufflavum DSM 19573]
MKMVTDKFKLYKFNIIISIMCAILIGLSYLQVKTKFLGIIFVIIAICSVIISIFYFVEKRKQ